MKTIIDDEFVFGTPPPKQSAGQPSHYGPNLPPEGSPPLPKGDIKPLNLNDSKDLNYVIDLFSKPAATSGCLGCDVIEILK
jgi:hypothetical protein